MVVGMSQILASFSYPLSINCSKMGIGFVPNRAGFNIIDMVNLVILLSQGSQLY